MAGTVIVPWYATGFRADGFEEALNEIAAVALRYGASSYAVYRSRDDRYRFQQLAHFDEHIDWERFWDGPEMIDFRMRHSSWYQIPVLYGWWDRTAAGSIDGERTAAEPNGRQRRHGNRRRHRRVERDERLAGPRKPVTSHSARHGLTAAATAAGCVYGAMWPPCNHLRCAPGRLAARRRPHCGLTSLSWAPWITTWARGCLARPRLTPSISLLAARISPHRPRGCRA